MFKLDRLIKNKEVLINNNCNIYYELINKINNKLPIIDHEFDLTNDDILNVLGLYHCYESDNYYIGEIYLKKAINYGNIFASFNLGSRYCNDIVNSPWYFLKSLFCFVDQNKINFMESCLSVAIENDIDQAMFNLGYYYQYCEEYELMEKYYLMAIKKNNINAIYHYAHYIEKNTIYFSNDKNNQNRQGMFDNKYVYEYDINMVNKMCNYYLIAINLGHKESFLRLTIFYNKLAFRYREIYEFNKEKIYILKNEYVHKLYKFRNNLEEREKLGSIDDFLKKEDFELIKYF